MPPATLVFGEAGALFIDRLDRAVVGCGAAIADAFRAEGVFAAGGRRAINCDGAWIGLGGAVASPPMFLVAFSWVAAMCNLLF